MNLPWTCSCGRKVPWTIDVRPRAWPPLARRVRRAGPAPAQADCRLELQLSDGSATRSNTVVVPLR